jgi:putative phage-type endonuclease
MPLLQVEQNSDAWLAARHGGIHRITASNAAACLGLSPWCSRQKAYRIARGEETERENAAMKWGHDKEDSARQSYEVETSNLAVPTGFWVHDHYPWLGASPDRLVGECGLLEVKCPASLPASVPIHHRVQMLVQLACTNREWCDYFAWTPQGHFLRRVHRAGTEGLIRRLKLFYESYILPGTPPPRRCRSKKKGLPDE